MISRWMGLSDHSEGGRRGGGGSGEGVTKTWCGQRLAELECFLRQVLSGIYQSGVVTGLYWKGALHHYQTGGNGPGADRTQCYCAAAAPPPPAHCCLIVKCTLGKSTALDRIPLLRLLQLPLPVVTFLWCHSCRLTLGATHQALSILFWRSSG